MYEIVVYNSHKVKHNLNGDVASQQERKALQMLMRVHIFISTYIHKHIQIHRNTMLQEMCKHSKALKEGFGKEYEQKKMHAKVQ